MARLLMWTPAQFTAISLIMVASSGAHRLFLKASGDFCRRGCDSESGEGAGRAEIEAWIVWLCSYAGNETSTRKYSWWSFVPLALFVQYQRAAYWYFTAMAGLSLAPFAPYGAISVWLPLIFVLILGLLREAWEDLRRARGDRELNNRPIEAHDGNGKFVEKRWRDLRVGDLIRVKDGDFFPSDLLLVSSTGPDGICYVETMNLDGETNLKVILCSAV
jgi:hypothetical protein